VWNEIRIQAMSSGAARNATGTLAPPWRAGAVVERRKVPATASQIASIHE
jgi:hypothetical protein